VAGFDVVLNDVSADRLKSAMATINGNLTRQVAKKFITEDARKQALARRQRGLVEWIDIRYAVAASSHSECQIQNSTRNLHFLAVLRF
jgi:3-hydroxyacyl-CoA dehydrogenase